MKARHLVWIRRISQTSFLVFFLLLLVETRLPHDVYISFSPVATAQDDLRLDQPITVFFQLDPLVWLTSLASAHVWVKGSLWAVGILILTLFLGRVFCGFICPLGTIHHMASQIRPALKGARLISTNQKN
ncbi:MAG: 4Fe-4S binding protein, partial [Desulfobacteraceae bacterium]|nr:4Fe-4S binding protein [Desulfobacteraceae bacterium]